jgi:hypothetical protein
MHVTGPLVSVAVSPDTEKSNVHPDARVDVQEMPEP